MYVTCVLLTPLCQYLQHVLDVAKMKARAEEGNEFRNNLVQLGSGVERFYLHLKDRMETRYTCTSAHLYLCTPTVRHCTSAHLYPCSAPLHPCSCRYLRHSAYATVSMTKIFEGLFPKPDGLKVEEVTAPGQA